MKLNLYIPDILKVHYNNEISLYKQQLERGELQLAWRHLERAHIIGQSYPFEHTAAHWKMLGFAIKIKNVKEIVGQIPRLLVGGVKSFVGKVPLGNSGGANVPALKPMEIPEDIKVILALYKSH